MECRKIARDLVGNALRVEALAKCIATNLRTTNRLEHLHDDHVRYDVDKAFVKMRELRYEDVEAWMRDLAAESKPDDKARRRRNNRPARGASRTSPQRRRRR